MHTKPTTPNPPAIHLPRAIRTHECTEADKLLQIHAGPSGPGGAPVFYQITMPNIVDDRVLGSASVMLSFQHGPICENGLNGITIESLLAVAEDRIDCFQHGAHPCEENATALYWIRQARTALHNRTRRRQREHAEGTSIADSMSAGEKLTREHYSDEEIEHTADTILRKADELMGKSKPSSTVLPPISICRCDDVEIGSHDACVAVRTPEFIRGTFGCKTNGELISIDACMVPEVVWLWGQKIITLGCCCGHGKQSATITVDESSIDGMFDLGYQQLDDHPMTFVSRSIRYQRAEGSAS